jgi:hypothetical protein
MSLGYCERCERSGREPLWAAVFVVARVGGDLARLSPRTKAIVDATLQAAGVEWSSFTRLVAERMRMPGAPAPGIEPLHMFRDDHDAD